MMDFPPGDICEPCTVSDCPAGARPLQVAHRFGCALAGEVDLKAGVYGDKLVVLTDGIWIIGERAGLEQNGGIVVDVVVQPLTAHREGAYGIPVEKPLLGIVYGAALDQVDHGLGKHFRVNA